jgi:hypothetical protein
VCVCVCVCVWRGWGVEIVLRRLPTSIFHCLQLFHSPILRPLSLMAVYTYIPSFQVLRGRPRFFLPTGFQLIIIFGNRVRSILSTRPYQMSCFQVISSIIVSGASIFFWYIPSFFYLVYRCLLIVLMHPSQLRWFSSCHPHINPKFQLRRLRHF